MLSRTRGEELPTCNAGALCRRAVDVGLLAAVLTSPVCPLVTVAGGCTLSCAWDVSFLLPSTLEVAVVVITLVPVVREEEEPDTGVAVPAPLDESLSACLGLKELGGVRVFAPQARKVADPVRTLVTAHCGDLTTLTDGEVLTTSTVFFLGGGNGDDFLG